MLVLSRRPQQQIVLCDAEALAERLPEKLTLCDGLITITILSVEGSTVRLGIDAPKDVAVKRVEVYEKQLAEAAAAASSAC